VRNEFATAVSRNFALAPAGRLLLDRAFYDSMKACWAALPGLLAKLCGLLHSLYRISPSAFGNSYRNRSHRTHNDFDKSKAVSSSTVMTPMLGNGRSDGLREWLQRGMVEGHVGRFYDG